MSTAAEESTDGKKHMPKAIIFSLVNAMLLYVAAKLVLTGMRNYQDIDPTAGFASAFNGVGLPVIATISSVFAAGLHLQTDQVVDLRRVCAFDLRLRFVPRTGARARP